MRLGRLFRDAVVSWKAPDEETVVTLKRREIRIQRRGSDENVHFTLGVKVPGDTVYCAMDRQQMLQLAKALTNMAQTENPTERTTQ